MQITKGYGDHIGFSDELFKMLVQIFLTSKEEVLKNSNILLQLDLIDENDFINLKKNSCLIGSLNFSAK